MTKIEKRMLEVGISISELAELVDKTYSTVHNVVQNGLKNKKRSARPYAKALCTTVNELMEESND